jgi:2-C-methyl-D-erythritol 2,4-cyclodiphosphate synthase
MVSNTQRGSSTGPKVERNRLVYRVGIGHDTHRTQSSGSLRLGGIDVPADYGLVGHSDADVLLHAITDALLGAAALGDIGEMFPNTDEANRDRDSADMLKLAYGQVQKVGYEIVNLDCIVFAERPKLSTQKTAIQQRIAEILKVRTNQVGVKAKTGEGVGPVGREEAVMAQCVALLRQTDGSQDNHN